MKKDMIKKIIIGFGVLLLFVLCLLKQFAFLFRQSKIARDIEVSRIMQDLISLTQDKYDITVYPEDYDRLMKMQKLSPNSLCFQNRRKKAFSAKLTANQILNILKKCDTIKLKILKISDCMHGSDELWEKVSEFSNLEMLSLFSCNYPGKLFSKLKNLKVLMLESPVNAGTTTLPSEVFDLPELVYLGIIGSPIKTLPKEIARLHILGVLEIKYSDLESLPQEIELMKNLRYLNVYSCELADVPVDFSKLPNLKALTLRKNKLTQLPKGTDNIELIDLSENLWDTVPAELLQKKDRTELSLARSNLTSIPKEVFEMKQLRKLDLSWNKDLKTLPPEIGNLKNLEYLDCSGCSLRNLPKELGKLKKLRYLRLWNNWIGELPAEIGNLENLENLMLENCALKTLPKEIGKLKKLKDLNLRSNYGIRLPDEIGDLKNLESLSVSSCNLMKLPNWIGRLKNLRSLLIGGNDRLTELPPEIYKLDKLTYVSNYGPKNKIEFKKAKK